MIFVDDDDVQKTWYVEIVELLPSCVRFRTKDNNIITVPLSRVVKIKQRGVAE